MAETNPSDPLKNCDIVMKGGITSGIVYPPAILELSKTYQFKNIGGASAGAIAAVATAAAEYGRLKKAGPQAGFQKLAQLPDDLAKPGFLLGVFSPSAGTAKGYSVAISVMKAQGIAARFAAGLWSLVTNFIGAIVLGLVGSAVLIFIISRIGMRAAKWPQFASRRREGPLPNANFLLGAVYDHCCPK